MAKNKTKDTAPCQWFLKSFKGFLLVFLRIKATRGCQPNKENQSGVSTFFLLRNGFLAFVFRQIFLLSLNAIITIALVEDEHQKKYSS